MPEPTAKPTLPNGREIGDHDPIMLRDAAALMFPDGSIGEKALRRLRDRGQLDCSRIRGRDYTTLADMRVMLERTRVQPKAPAFKPGPRPKTEAEVNAEMETARVSLRAKLAALRIPTTKPRGKQARKPPEPPPKPKTRKRLLTPRIQK